MTTIIITGWKDGFEKVSLTKLQMELLKKTLKESKTNVDSLLDGEQLIFEIQNLAIAHEFVDKARAIGSLVEIDEDGF